jgi:hypothetical protein
MFVDPFHRISGESMFWRRRDERPTAPTTLNPLNSEDVSRVFVLFGGCSFLITPMDELDRVDVEMFVETSNDPSAYRGLWPPYVQFYAIPKTSAGMIIPWATGIASIDEAMGEGVTAMRGEIRALTAGQTSLEGGHIVITGKVYVDLTFSYAVGEEKTFYAAIDDFVVSITLDGQILTGDIPA